MGNHRMISTSLPQDGGDYVAISIFSVLELPKRAGDMQSFQFSLRWQGLHSHFISPRDCRGYKAISCLPEKVGVMQPFSFSMRQQGRVHATHPQYYAKGSTRPTATKNKTTAPYQPMLGNVVALRAYMVNPTRKETHPKPPTTSVQKGKAARETCVMFCFLQPCIWTDSCLC